MIVPQFPAFSDFSMAHQELFSQYCQRFQPTLSELTFSNLFLWNETKRLKISRFDDSLILLSAPHGQTAYLFQPLGQLDWNAFFSVWKDNLDVLPSDMRLIEEKHLEVFQDLSPQSERDHWDYLYNWEDLSNLNGRKYSKKRNHLNKFFKAGYDYRLEPITEENHIDLVNFLIRWCQMRGCDEDAAKQLEYRAIVKCVEFWESLPCIGAGLYVNGRMEAFTVGEPLNDSTFVVHFEKANPDFNGIYQLINREFACHYIRNASFINREQDLGLEGLRQAKERYFPCDYIKKYRVSL